MSEEKITLLIMDDLKNKGWTIISIDYPQSGTGMRFVKNGVRNAINAKDTIIPDIIALKNKSLMIWENKVNFSMKDVLKYSSFQTEYADSIKNNLHAFKYNEMFCGIGLHFSQYNVGKANNNTALIDFIQFVDDDSKVITHKTDPNCLL